ncbi:beta-1,4-glucuronyltransferase 1-like [Cylas formicarius]|uniref:beta-1,4-glucuronyltransferase 1-like n=1 Tax=Cylas formicarius TaxID=197179 RepID=UPI002958BF81|nr:beta-1,4-glucuronyltransferase 1-like [Cylas formicarius]
MVIVRTSRLFKLCFAGIVVTLFLMMVSRKGISQRTGYVGYITLYPRSEKDIVDVEQDYTENEYVEVTTSRIIDEKMPGAFLRSIPPVKQTNKSYCKFNYGLPYDLKYKARHIGFSPEIGRAGPYRIIHNVTEAWHFDGVPMVTYASHVTANFAYYIPELLRYWDGLVSLSAFVPDLDVAMFLEQINQYCYCVPGMARVSIHLIYHKGIPMSKKDVYFTRPDDCLIQDSSKIKTHRDFDDTVVYPVNVCRNVARNSSLTKFVMVSDIQLMPSKDLARRFLQMVDKYHKNNTGEVFVVPIFEVEETERVPRTKNELIRLLADRKAVYFHGMVCEHCQKFPAIEKWVMSDSGKTIKPFYTVKRRFPYHRWEPIFIGTNAEPLYNEKLSWDGLQDKMPQSLEMCLRDYDYTVLDGCFLVHWPGMKKTKIVDEEWRIPFVRDNMREYKKILGRFYKKYKIIPQCKILTVSKLPGFNETIN